MKKLPACCIIAVLLTVTADKANATIVALTSGIETPIKPALTGRHHLTEYDEKTILFPYKNKVPNAAYIPDNNDTTLSNKLDMTNGHLTGDGGAIVDYGPMTNIALLILKASQFSDNNVLKAVHVRDNNDLILPIIPAGIPGSLILEDKGFPEYNPIPEVAKLLPYKSCLAINNILDIIYIRRNKNTIRPDTPGVTFGGSISGKSNTTKNKPLINKATLFFKVKDLSVTNHFYETPNISSTYNILSAVPNAASEVLSFDNTCPAVYNSITNFRPSHLQKNNFANIRTCYTTKDSTIIPEPAPIAVLGFGSLFLVRKHKSNHRNARLRLTQVK
jgi:hypothetical protein